ncbi:MAG: hypothetical protein PHW76_01750 [Alphaproteobacteria bacterium]|nr:hypothetical protein [Alphaproteobacteria bacterium]
MSKAFAFVFCALFCCSAFAQDSDRPPQASLFLTPQEEHEAEMLARRLSPPGKGDLHLGAVLYYGPEDWTLWLQGEKWTPSTRREGIKILEVGESAVRILWTNPEDNAPLEVTLHPNEAYQIATGKIILDR